MVLPPSTAEELEVVLATKRRLGVSEDPQKVRKAVLELRQRRATAAWKTWYAAQQAAAQAHHARFLQWQWHMERQHAAGLAAAVMAAEQRAAAAERREREAAAADIASPGSFSVAVAAAERGNSRLGVREGCRVSADYGGLGYYHDATVTAVNSNGTLDLLYDDGLREEGGRSVRVRAHV